MTPERNFINDCVNKDLFILRSCYSFCHPIRGRNISYGTPRPGIRNRVGEPYLLEVLKFIEFYNPDLSVQS